VKEITEYLDMLKQKTGSDYQTAIQMECDRAVISKIRKRNRMDDDNALRMAELLGIDKCELLLAATIARSSGETKKAWEEISKRAGIAS
jgi:hypothetical protein